LTLDGFLDLAGDADVDVDASVLGEVVPPVCLAAKVLVEAVPVPVVLDFLDLVAVTADLRIPPAR
jgi:hypothetical protein